MLRALNFAVRLTKKVSPMLQTNANGNGNVQLDVYKPTKERDAKPLSIRDHILREKFITICTKAAFEGNQANDDKSVEGLHTLLNDLVKEAETSEDNRDIDTFLEYFLSLWMSVVRFADTPSAMLAAFYRSDMAKEYSNLTSYVTYRLSRLLDGSSS